MSRRSLQWENTLNLVLAHNAYESDGVDAAGRVAAEQIRKLRKEIRFPPLTPKDRREQVLEELEELADSFENELCDEEEEYNYYLAQLYDLGDDDKLIWVATEEWQVRAS